MSAHPRQTVPLGELHPDTGLLAQQVQLFAARVESVGELERHEGIRRAKVVTCAEAEEMVRTGDITDAFTIAVLYRARLAGLFD
ncbi:MULTISPECIES: hypothetical protein [unclassified Streptomyces]|uniref:hypothetical protein n=1 Tax=unclassified Streptomyces TaxID=2593676 RepID=UPI003D8D5ADC